MRESNLEVGFHINFFAAADRLTHMISLHPQSVSRDQLPEGELK